MKTKYNFTSSRLGFRNWKDSDIDKLLQLNQDKEVMKYFPNLQNKSHTKLFVERMQKEYQNNGFCYYAVETLDTKEFIGFIGFSKPESDNDPLKSVDIGWRLATKAWRKGFATEGAKRCLEYGFKELNFTNICSIAPKVNEKSQSVMKNIGMKFDAEFKHPCLKDYEELEECVLYTLSINN
jgi:RimJ/RimL family protein N-acetyltransferase